jgi:hypothetical protein
VRQLVDFIGHGSVPGNFRHGGENTDFIGSRNRPMGVRSIHPMPNIGRRLSLLA